MSSKEKFGQPADAVKVIEEKMSYGKLSEAINTAKSLNDLRDIRGKLDNVTGQERIDLNNMFLMQWRVLGGS